VPPNKKALMLTRLSVGLRPPLALAAERRYVGRALSWQLTRRRKRMDISPLVGAYVAGLFSFVGVIWASARSARTAREVESLKATLSEASALRLEDRKAQSAHSAAVDLANRKSRLERVNSQLKLLYGPLYALTNASNRSWIAFRSTCRPSGAFFDSSSPPTESELKEWRLWMTTVFMPLNLEMEKLILSNMDLLVGDEIDSSLVELCAHVQAYKTVLRRWETQDFSVHHAPMDFPSEEVRKVVSTNFALLKQEQQALLELTFGQGAVTAPD
jgi:hypothetical protein